MRDLMIISRSRVAMSDLLERFPDLTTRYEVRFELRWRERRSTSTSRGTDRRRQERRRLDVSEPLQQTGWVIVPAAQRGVLT